MAMIRVKNIFPITKSATVDRKEYIFKCHEEKIVSDAFLSSNGIPLFPWMKITGFLKEDGKIVGHKRFSDEETSKPNTMSYAQKYIYVLENEVTGEKKITSRIQDVAKDLGFVHYQNIARVFKNRTEWKRHDWNVKRYTIEEYRKINPDFFIGSNVINYKRNISEE